MVLLSQPTRGPTRGVRDRITIAALETETAYELERDPYGPSRARKATDPIPGPQVHVSGRFGNLNGSIPVLAEA
jgi:hypothetical protein